MRRKHVEAGIRPAGLVRRRTGRGSRSNYFDLAMIMDYWGKARLNHHTEATSMLYAARECARIVLREGSTRRFARHALASTALVAGLEAMGLKLFGDQAPQDAERHRRHIPEGVDGDKVRGAAARRLRHRDRHLVRAAARPHLAHRHHGLQLPQAERPHLPGRPGGRLRRAGLSVPAGAAVEAAYRTYSLPPP